MTRTIANTPEALAAFAASLEAIRLVVCEATGGYEDALLAALHVCLASQIKALEAAIAALMAGADDLVRARKTLRAIPGLGATDAAALMPELGHIDRRQAAALAGVAPIPTGAAPPTPTAAPAAGAPRSSAPCSWPPWPQAGTIPTSGTATGAL